MQIESPSGVSRGGHCRREDPWVDFSFTGSRTMDSRAPQSLCHCSNTGPLVCHYDFLRSYSLELETVRHMQHADRCGVSQVRRFTARNSNTVHSSTTRQQGHILDSFFSLLTAGQLPLWKLRPIRIPSGLGRSFQRKGSCLETRLSRLKKHCQGWLKCLALMGEIPLRSPHPILGDHHGPREVRCEGARHQGLRG